MEFYFSTAATTRLSLASKRSIALLILLLPLFMTGCDLLSKSEVAQKKPTPTKPHLVETSSIETLSLGHSTQRTGTLTALGRVKIFNQEEGRIDKLHLFAGDRVNQGDLIVHLDDRLLLSQLAKTVANRERAEADLKRTETLSKKNLSSTEKMIQARTDLKVSQAEEALIRTRLGYTQIRAPFDGVVTERLVDPGDIAPRHTHLLSIIDPDSLYTEVTISELLLPQFNVGDMAQVRIDALGEGLFPGKIVRIHPTIDSRTRQGVVEVKLLDTPPGAAAGQLCRVRLHTPAINRLVTSFAALQRGRQSEYVFVLADGVAHKRDVVTGLRLGDKVEILEGLKAGDRVVIRGFLGLTDGKNIQVVNHDDAEKPTL
ncbi:MAG: efflux RND transporter periplasmic adaptor subunit [Magnetococcales bacterium]|nr:efflux RND transporter periplasmic adaptor subunit [Magnetococcales bacterium]